MKPAKLTTSVRSMGDSSLIALLMVVATLLVSISVVVSRLFIGDVRFNNKVISRKNVVNATLEKNVQALPALQENFRFLEQNGPKPELVLRALPVRDEFSALGRELEAMASLSGAQLIAVTKSATDTETSSPAGAPSPIPVSFQVSIMGAYPNLQAFLARLEQSVRPTLINRATFNGADPTVTLSLELTAWWQPTTAVSGSTEEISE